MPKLAVDPGNAGDETIGLDGAQYRSRFGVDLVNLAFAIFADPERPFRPGEARIAAIAGRGNGRNYATGMGIDLLDAAVGDLEQVFAVEGGAGMRGDLDGIERLAVRRVDRVQPVAG